ncbi:MAG: hypothetical protein WC716_05250 [Chitinophagaceae bacterium]|jgi:predicted negative regulator of RcsB-dependent stress response
MIRFTGVLIAFFLFGHSAFAGDYVYDFNSNCQKAYNEIMALKNVEAKNTLQAELKRNPDNIIPEYLADYADCLNLLFNGNPADLIALKENAEKRLELVEKGPKNNPWHRFCKANINLHWALVHLRFGENFKAAAKFRKSFLLLRENKNLYPDFKENNVLLGLEESIAGAIPDNYKWLGSVFGIKGNINNGVNKIATYLKSSPERNTPMYEEAMIYYAYLKFYLLSSQETAWKYINGGQYNEADNLLRSFIKANLALNYRKADIALRILIKAENIREYKHFPIFHYERAEAMLLKLDFNCQSHFQQFLKDYKGSNFSKDSWLKLAWVAYLQQNSQRKEYCLNQLKSTGNTLTDADKQAQRFAENPVWPMPALLEVRLFIDGGFYQNALLKIQNIDKKQLTETANILDYNFRYGRICEELNQAENALAFYSATIYFGRNRKEYYAARAALHKGFIYERQEKKTEAITAFKDCLSMRNHDFQSSIDQLAKAALNRLGN